MNMLPTITITRQYGSGGHEVGEKIASKLDIPFYDKSLIALAAKKSGYSIEILENVDERATNSLLYSMVMSNYIDGGTISKLNVPINDRLFIIQADIIKKAAREGPCVIIGRCADYVLREHENLLRLFIHADKAKRIERLLALDLVEEKKAADVITKKDKQRSNYYNFYSNNRWGDLMNYDLTVSTSTFGVDKAVDLIIEAAKAFEK